MFKSLTKGQAADMRTVNYSHYFHTAMTVPTHYNYQPKQGFVRLSPPIVIPKQVLTLSIAIVALSIAWLLNQPSNAEYQPSYPLLKIENIDFNNSFSFNNTQIKINLEKIIPKARLINRIEPNIGTMPLQSKLLSVNNGQQLLNAVLPISNLEQLLNRPILPKKTTYTTEVEDKVLQFKVKRGDNLSIIFDRYGLNRKQLYKFLSIKKYKKSLGQLRLGQKIEIQHQANGDVDTLRLSLDPRRDLLISKPEQKQKFLATILNKPISIETVTKSVIIRRSLVADAKKAGLPHKLTFQLADIFGWDVDFGLGLEKGDHFTVLYEEQYSSEGQLIGFGHILAAEIHNNASTYQAIRYTNKQGKTNYYNAKGQILEKTFLRSPVKAGYISSKFNLKRRHPVLNTIRAHKGVDYAAPKGTPIYATASGVVKHKGYKNGYGKTVSLEHGSGYSTLYGHMSRYAKHLKKGKFVKQGQLIGYVGRTGLATGTHLHYEFYKDGQVKNPLTVKFPNTLSEINSKEKRKFKKQAKALFSQLSKNSRMAKK